MIDVQKLERNIAEWLQAQLESGKGCMAGVDAWSRKRIVVENQAKLALVLEAGDPADHCYENLVREIDMEAQAGIFLPAPSASAARLRRISGEGGVSGRLNEYLRVVAPILFADAFRHSNHELDLVWTTIQARYDRANLDAEVSELILTRLSSGDAAIADTTDALRSMFYAYHEYLARARCNLPRLIPEEDGHQLGKTIARIRERAGDYCRRTALIADRAGTG